MEIKNKIIREIEGFDYWVGSTWFGHSTFDDDFWSFASELRWKYRHDLLEPDILDNADVVIDYFEYAHVFILAGALVFKRESEETNTFEDGISNEIIDIYAKDKDTFFKRFEIYFRELCVAKPTERQKKYFTHLVKSYGEKRGVTVKKGWDFQKELYGLTKGEVGVCIGALASLDGEEKIKDEKVLKITERFFE